MRQHRTIQEFLGHADDKTTQIYAHYSRSEHEVEIVNDAFGARTLSMDGSQTSKPATEMTADRRRLNSVSDAAISREPSNKLPLESRRYGARQPFKPPQRQIIPIRITQIGEPGCVLMRQTYEADDCARALQ